ncbi:MAG: hypothetical protein AAF442_03845 [Pseudomonadota bacterium]
MANKTKNPRSSRRFGKTLSIGSIIDSLPGGMDYDIEQLKELWDQISAGTPYEGESQVISVQAPKTARLMMNAPHSVSENRIKETKRKDDEAKATLIVRASPGVILPLMHEAPQLLTGLNRLLAHQAGEGNAPAPLTHLRVIRRST